MAEPAPRFDARLEEGVQYFEQMLQLMPDDRVTLEFLAVAYDQLGEREKGQKTVVSLANLLLKQGDLAAAEGLLPRLEAIDSNEAKILALRIRRLTAPSPELVPETPKALTPAELAAEETRDGVDAEVSLVELLWSNGVIVSEEDAKRLRDQTTATPSGGGPFLVSALAILEKENFELCEKCLAFLADRFSMPPVSISSFERNAELVGRFPAETLRIRGVVPFARIGDVALVALLNPADERLRERLDGVMTCRYYLAMPSAVETWLAAAFAGGGPSP
ncbi:MAG: hypothetical protein IKE55_09005 [Kiritimatiellae bacterium]|nr:hypothetical protein [Kiritimatiellia bacterium]